MYQVVELYGDFEPWWFLDDWKDDMVFYQEFEQFEEAFCFFKSKWTQFKVSHPYFRSRASLLAAFWHEEDQSWCEDCTESLQTYRSLALLKDWEELPSDYRRAVFEQRNDNPVPLSACKLRKIG